MELKFLGRGSAFNPKEGSNSAYFIEDDKLFLIDCGESTFKSLIEDNLFNGIDEIYLFITHTHSDHIGSLGSLLSYNYYYLNKSFYIVIRNDNKHFLAIEKVIDAFGYNEGYKVITDQECDNCFKIFKSIRYIETNHSKNLDCYGIIFETSSGIIYYSGDTKDLNNVKLLIANNQKIDKLYLDTSLNDFHLNLTTIYNELPKSLHNKVYCMHLENDEVITKAQEKGFNIVEIEQKK